MFQDPRPHWTDVAMAGGGADAVGPLFPWRDAMDACEHDPIHHAEGSPWIHTALVVQALDARIADMNLPPERAGILRLAGWAHDMAKPFTTKIEFEDGLRRVRQPGHAPLGARMIWQELIDSGHPASLARDVSALVGWHMRPTHLHELDETKILHRLVRFSIESGGGGWHELMALSRSDQDGRISRDANRDKHLLLDLLELQMEEISRAQDWDISTPWPFLSSQARLQGLSDRGSPHYTPLPPAGSRVIVMSGLPGSGKDSWISRNGPDVEVISLDAIRKRIGAGPSGAQGEVTRIALGRARHLLRDRQPFIFNATNLSHVARGKILKLCRSHDAEVTAISLDIPLDEALRRNGSREEPVPEDVIRYLARKREPIQPSEVHSLISIDRGGVARDMFEADGACRERPDPSP